MGNKKLIEDYNKNDIFWKDFVNLPGNPYKMDSDMSGFKCLFVFLTLEKDFSKNDYPLSFGYMASLLRMNGGDATILIQDINEYNPDKFKGYNLICFYPTTILLPQILEFVNKIKKEDNLNQKICFFNSDQHQHEMILCNPLAASFSRTIMEECSSIDFILFGEAEFSFIKLCEKLFKKETDFENIPSCLYRKNGEIDISKEPICSVDFKFLPFPSRDFLEETITENGINFFSPRVQSSRGCLSRCFYCVESCSNITLGGRKMPVLQRDIFRFLDEIEMLYKKYKVIFFNIIDSSFEDLGQKGLERMNIFFDEILKRGIEASFKIHLRMETFSKLDESFIKKIKDAGGDILIVGVESTIERELNSYKKITTVKESLKNLEKLDEFGKFWILIGHIMFSACLKLEDLPKKIKFMKDYNRTWDYGLMCSILLAYRGTAYHNFLKENNLELPSEKLSAIIPYLYEDPRILNISEEMNNLKKRCPEVIKLQNLLYDAMNIISRYSNKMNRHLWKKEEIFLAFKKELNHIINEVGDVYFDYFSSLIDLAKLGWSDEKANALYEKYIPNFFPEVYEKTKKLIDNLTENFENAGLSTDKLYLKTGWRQTVQINTFGGKIGK